MFSPTLLVGHPQRAGIVVAIARVVALRATQKSQTTNSPAPTETRRERIEPAIARARSVRRTALIRAEKYTRALALREHHQRVPSVVIEQHEAPRFADQIDLARGEPSHELRGSSTRRIGQAPQIRVCERNPQIATAIAATRAAKSQMTEAARH